MKAVQAELNRDLEQNSEESMDTMTFMFGGKNTPSSTLETDLSKE